MPELQRASMDKLHGQDVWERVNPAFLAGEAAFYESP